MLEGSTPFYDNIKPLRIYNFGNDSIVLKLNSLSGVMFYPVVSSEKEFFENISLFFGIKEYQKYFRNILYPKMIQYKNIVGGKTIRIKVDQEIDMDKLIKLNTPNLMSGYFIKNNKNTILFTIPKHKLLFHESDEKFWSKLSMYDNIDSMLAEVVFSSFGIPQLLYSKGYQDGLSITPDSFNKIVISIPITTKKKSHIKFIDPINKMTKQFMMDRKSGLELGFIRFLMMHLVGETVETFSESISELIERYANISIVFYNDKKQSFIFDFDKMRNSEKISYKQALTRVKKCLNVLISGNNADEINIDDSVEDDIEISESKSIDINKVPTKEITIEKLKKNAKEIDTVEKATGNRTHTSEIEDQIESEMDEISVNEAKQDMSNSEYLDDIEDIPLPKTKPKKTEAQLRRIEVAKNKYKSITTEDGRSIEEVLADKESVVIDKKEVKVNIRDKSLKNSNLIDFDKSYREKTFEKDMIGVLKSFSNDDKSMKMHIIEMKEEDASDQFTRKKKVSVVFEDENQKRHTMHINVPVPDADGFYWINGNKKVLRNQLMKLPVTKEKPDLVEIATNYNKVFLYRQGTVINYRTTLLDKLIVKFLQDSPDCNISIGNNLSANSSVLTSIEYDELSKKYHLIALKKGKNKATFYFNQKEIRDKIVKLGIKYKFSPEKLPIGISNGSVVDVDLNTSSLSTASIIMDHIEQFGIIPDFEEVIKKFNIPKRRLYTRMVFQSKRIPLICFLGYLFGLSKVIGISKTKVERSDKKIRGDKRLFIRFKDCYLYYDEYPIANALLLNGLTEFDTEEFDIDEFDGESPYSDYIFEVLQQRNTLKGFTSFRELFIDPITLEVLKDLDLPTDFLELFLYANDLLADNKYTDASSVGLYRIRKEEMINALLYKSMCTQYKIVKQRSGSYNKFTLNEDELINSLNMTSIFDNYDTINPINELKTVKSGLTFKGPGGLNESRAFPMDKRGYNSDMKGVVAMSSVDSSKVGVDKQLSLSPRIVSTRGYIEPCASKKDARSLTFAQVASPEEAVVPFINKHDDPKRVGFTSGQTKHIMPVDKGAPAPVSTGMDSVLSSYIGDDFAFKAKGPGKIIKVDEENGYGIIQYKDGSKEEFTTNPKFNRNSNFFIESKHTLNIKEGQTVGEGDILTYDERFFSKADNGDIVLTQGFNARVALVEGCATEEDSSSITQEFSKYMTTTTIKRKQISLGAYSNIFSWKGVGDHVQVGDNLIAFEDVSDRDTGESSVNEMIDLLGEGSEDLIADMTQHKPRSNATGEIVDVKVYWTVDPKDMSESCKKIVNDYKKRVRKKIKFDKEHGIESDDKYKLEISERNLGRINGAVMPDEGILIEYYIKHHEGLGIGDKISFFSSLKSVIADVIPEGQEPYTDETDEHVDAILGMLSPQARMITSVYLAGFYGKILDDYGKRVAREFLGKK